MENSEQIKEWAKGYGKKLSEETTANEEKHLNHPFYAEANQYRETVRREQVLKGAHKYPEPFTTASWTNQEIIDHAMQENVDQAHYIYAAKERMEELGKEIKWLRGLIKTHEEVVDGYHKEIVNLKKERDEAYQGCEKYRKKWNGVIKQLSDKAKEIEDLKITNEKLNNRAENWEKTAYRNAEKAHNELDRLTIRANGNYNAMLEVEKERDQFKKQYLKAHAEIQDLQYQKKILAEQLTLATSGEKKTHDCHKNQAIHWQGKDIVKVKCQICDKTLYQA